MYDVVLGFEITSVASRHVAKFIHRAREESPLVSGDDHPGILREYPLARQAQSNASFRLLVRVVSLSVRSYCFQSNTIFYKE